MERKWKISNQILLWKWKSVVFFLIYFSGIAREKELEPFTNSNTYKYLNYIQNDKYLADAFRTAYVFFKYFL